MNKVLGVLGVIIVLGVAGGLYYKVMKKSYQQPSVTVPSQTNIQTTDTVTPMVTQTTDTTTQGAVKEFTVTGANFSFDPTTITVNKGDTVKVTFKNAEGMHDFVIDEFNVRTKVIRGGSEETVQFIADKTGSFEYYCSVGTHRQMGMKGTLIVQ
jgi:nitrosocyanin